MTTKRKSFSKSEKVAVAIEAIKSELTMAQISSKYGVHSTQINNWKKQALDYLKEAFTNKKDNSQKLHEAELSKLYEEIGAQSLFPLDGVNLL